MNAADEWLGEEVCQEREPGARSWGTVGYRDDGAGRGLTVLFPPHPGLGGDAENNVIRALFQAARADGGAALVLTYRGVREGRVGARHALAYWDELDRTGAYGPVADDCAALIRQVRAGFATGPRLVLAGYSFGAFLAVRTAAETGAAAVACVSPPIREHAFGDWLDGSGRGAFFTAPADPFCPADALTTLAGSRPRPWPVRRIETDDHFFRGAEETLARAVLDFLKA